MAVTTMTWDPRYTGPYTDMVAVTPNDGADLAVVPARGLYVSVAGNVVVVTQDGTTVTLPVVASQDLSLAVKRVKATGTTATVFACY